MLTGVPEHCCQSSLWDRSVRDNVTDNKISEQVTLFLYDYVHMVMHNLFTSMYNYYIGKLQQKFIQHIDLNFFTSAVL